MSGERLGMLDGGEERRGNGRDAMGNFESD